MSIRKICVVITARPSYSRIKTALWAIQKHKDLLKHVKVVDPMQYAEFIQLLSEARLVITDSGGVQKEAYFFKKPCIILRPQTEWVEIVETGSAVITDANESAIIEAVNSFFSGKSLKFPPVFGDGHAAEFMAQEILNQLK